MQRVHRFDCGPYGLVQLHFLTQICSDCLSCSSICSFVLAQLPNCPCHISCGWDWVLSAAVRESANQSICQRLEGQKCQMGNRQMFSHPNPTAGCKTKLQFMAVMTYQLHLNGSIGSQRESPAPHKSCPPLSASLPWLL